MATNGATNVNDDTCTVHDGPEELSSPTERPPDNESFECATTLTQLAKPNEVVVRTTASKGASLPNPDASVKNMSQGRAAVFELPNNGKKLKCVGDHPCDGYHPYPEGTADGPPSPLTAGQKTVPKSHNYNIQFYHETNRKRPLSAWNVVLSWFYLNIHIACDINETDLSTFSEREIVQHLMSMKNYTDPESACGKLKTIKAKRCKKNKEYRPTLITQQGALGRFWKEEMRTNAHYSEISRRIQAVAKAEQEQYRNNAT